MSYQHTFYAIDVDKLVGFYGTADDSLLETVISAKREELDDNDEFFEDEIDGGGCPGSAQALGELLILGAPSSKEHPAMYGYVLGILCDHLGEYLEEEIVCVGDHPYESRLTTSGPPLPIPYDKGDFPEIGYLASAEIPAEIERIDAAPGVDDEELAEDISNYRALLVTAQSKGLGIVSLRH